MKKSLLKLFGIGMLTVSVIASCSAGDEGKKAQAAPQPVKAPVAKSAVAPDFALKDHDGNVVKLSDYKGKVVILDFWATWCGPCKMEIPGFIKLQQKYADKGVTIIGISLDQPGWQVVKPFMDEYGINYPIVLGDRNVVMAYGGITGIPTTFIINQNGEVVDKVVGYRPDSYFENAIKQLINS